MKKNTFIKLFLTAFLMSFFNCKSQTIVDLTSNVTLPNNYHSMGQYYEKDIHNYLENFVGTWEYTNGNDKFQLILTKITKYHFIDTDLNFNFYKDGIELQYKKFTNGNLVYESPTTGKPTFNTLNGQELEGAVTDYGRVTKTVNKPQMFGGGVFHQGGEYFYPNCTIEKLMTTINEPAKIKFHLYFREYVSDFGDPYDNPIYAGQPRFSIPNNIILTKVP